MRIVITPELLSRAGRAKRRFPCGANIRVGKNKRADVAFRPWHDGYDIFADRQSRHWLASFSDGSERGQTIIEGDFVRQRRHRLRARFR